MVVAGTDIPEGVALERAVLVVARWPRGTQPAGAFTSVDSVVSRVSRVPIYKGEAIVPGRLAPRGTGAGLEVKITPGKRAYGIRIDDVASLAGLVQPNSRVDVLAVVRDPKTGQRRAEIVLQNVRVLAIGAVSRRPEDGRPISAAVASLEVLPEEAQALALASKEGNFRLLLRGYGDPVVGDVAVGIYCDPNHSRLVHDLLLRSCPPSVAPPEIVAPRIDSFRVRIRPR